MLKQFQCTQIRCNFNKNKLIFRPFQHLHSLSILASKLSVILLRSRYDPSWCETLLIRHEPVMIAGSWRYTGAPTQKPTSSFRCTSSNFNLWAEVTWVQKVLPLTNSLSIQGEYLDRWNNASSIPLVFSRLEFFFTWYSVILSLTGNNLRALKANCIK